MIFRNPVSAIPGMALFVVPVAVKFTLRKPRSDASWHSLNRDLADSVLGTVLDSARRQIEPGTSVRFLYP